MLEDALEKIYSNFETVLAKLEQLKLENDFLKNENSELRKLVGELMTEAVNAL
jgi:regulator of replication initiation timing